MNELPPHHTAEPGERGQDETVGGTEQAVVEGGDADAAYDGELITGVASMQLRKRRSCERPDGHAELPDGPAEVAVDVLEGK